MNDAIDRFKYGVIIRGKFIGVADVKEDHGDEICRTSMIQLKALVLAKKEHKRRICVKISLDGVKILDEITNEPMFNHLVTKISYIARDFDDSRAIGYIYKNGTNSFQYFAMKTFGQAQEMFITLKELFDVVLEMRNKAKLQPLQPETKILTGYEKEDLQINEELKEDCVVIIYDVPDRDHPNHSYDGRTSKVPIREILNLEEARAANVK